MKTLSYCNLGWEIHLIWLGSTTGHGSWYWLWLCLIYKNFHSSSLPKTSWIVFGATLASNICQGLITYSALILFPNATSSHRRYSKVLHWKIIFFNSISSLIPPNKQHFSYLIFLGRFIEGFILFLIGFEFGFLEWKVGLALFYERGVNNWVLFLFQVSTLINSLVLWRRKGSPVSLHSRLTHIVVNTLIPQSMYSPISLILYLCIPRLVQYLLNYSTYK